MGKHTPGNWHVSDPPNAPFQDRIVYGGDNYLVADCSNIPRRTTEEEQANARLIAAAPDLYEACKKALELLEPFDDPDLSLGLGKNALTKLRNALAKAEAKL